MSSRETAREMVEKYNAALDVIWDENAAEEERQSARATTDTYGQMLRSHVDVGMCGCGDPLHVRIDCPIHGHLIKER